MELRDYQRNAIDAVYSYFEGGGGNPLIEAPTGSGKSPIIAFLVKEGLERWPNERFLILAHRKELIEQDAEKITTVWPEAPIGMYSAGLKKRELGRKITVGGIQSIYNKANKVGWISLVIVDECFPSYHSVDGIPMSKLQPGDLVRSVKLSSGELEFKEITAVRKSKIPTHMCRVTLNNGLIIDSTPNHPYYIRGVGFVEASKIKEGSYVNQMPLVQKGYRESQPEPEEELPSSRENVLFKNMFLRISRVFIKHSDERKKSHEKKGSQRENGSDATGYRSQTTNTRRKREENAGASQKIIGGIGRWLGRRICSPNKDEAFKDGLSNGIQNRHSPSNIENFDRSGRQKPPIIKSTGARSKEERVSSWVRVESVEIFEPRSDERYREMQGDGYVYNIQVAGNENYFCDDILVHNCHLIPHKDIGMYRTLFEDLKKTNPQLKIVGLTATPYRLDSGLLTEGKDKIFDDICYTISVAELIERGFLSPLVSKVSHVQGDLDSVSVRKKEYVAKQLQKVMDNDELIKKTVTEVIKYASNYQKKHWMFFCSGIDHALHVTEELQSRGIRADCVTSKTPPKERAQIISDYKNYHGDEPYAIVNVDVLTTGFDAPQIDLIALLRPTKSASLYVQMVGRGLRIWKDKLSCLILDFADNIREHGPIDSIKPRGKKTNSEGDEVTDVRGAPTKACPECESVNIIQARECADCGHEFILEGVFKHNYIPSDANILNDGQIPEWVEVNQVDYERHKKNGSPDSMKVTYWIEDFKKKHSEWICLNHIGFARNNAVRWLQARLDRGDMNYKDYYDEIQKVTLDEILQGKIRLKEPHVIMARRTGKYWEITNHGFATDEEKFSDIKPDMTEKEDLDMEPGITPIDEENMIW